MSQPTLDDGVPAEGAGFGSAPQRRLGLARLIGDPMVWPRAGENIRPGRPGAGYRGPIKGYVWQPWISHYTPKAALTRKALLGDLWRQLEVPMTPRELPLELRVTWAFYRPRYHFGTGRNAATVKPQYLHSRPGKGGGVTKDAAGNEHPTGGDLDNLLKLVKDALSGVAYEDDGAIARAPTEKLYIDQATLDEPETRIELWTL